MKDNSSLFEKDFPTQTASDILCSTEAIPGIGEKRAEKLSEKGIETVQDLLSEKYEPQIPNSSVRQQFSEFFVKQYPSPLDIGFQDMPSVFLFLAKIATQGTFYRKDKNIASSVKTAQYVHSGYETISIAKGKTPDAHRLSISSSFTVKTITDPHDEDALFITEYDGDNISNHPKDYSVEKTRWTLIDPKFLWTVSLLFGRDYTKPKNIKFIKILRNKKPHPIIVYSPNEKCSAVIANRYKSNDLNPWERKQKNINKPD